MGVRRGWMPVATRGTGVRTMLQPAGGEPPREYRLRVLGGWGLTDGGRPCTVQLRSQRLIALLAVAGPLPRAVICGRLWPESSEPHALDSLRVAIHHIGRDLPGLLNLMGPTVGLSASVAVDLAAERAALRADAAAAVDGAGPTTVAVSEMGLPAGRFQAEPELLPGWYEEWALSEQHVLRTERIDHHVRLAERLLDAGDRRGAVDFASRALALDPLDEWALEVLVRADLGLGATCAAQRALDSFRRQLRGEFGQLSSPMLERLQRLAATPPAADSLVLAEQRSGGTGTPLRPV